jgi:ADP-L-glycero-D-manno-heptose 6-epimerase
MKILVTGHKGFIGSHMLSRLCEHEVFTFEWGETSPDVSGLDWVIHIGGISSTTERDVEKVLRQNLDFSQDLLDQCCEARVNFQYSSSASIYGLGRDFRESAPVDPRTPYAWSKYLFERYAARKQQTSSICIQGFRYFNVYGAGEEHKGGQASPFTQFRQQAEQLGRIRLFRGSEAYWRDFVPVETVVDTHVKFFDVAESGVWNTGTGQVRSFEQVAAEFDVPVDYVDMPDDLSHSYQTYTCADLTHLRSTLARYGCL